METAKSKALARANAIENSARNTDSIGPYWRFDHNTLPLYKRALKEAYGGFNINVPDSILGDLTQNERRELVGYPALADDQADEQLLAERLGVGGTDAFISVVSDERLGSEQKKQTLKLLFGLTNEQVDAVV